VAATLCYVAVASSKATVGTFAPAPQGSVPPVPPDREARKCRRAPELGCIPQRDIQERVSENVGLVMCRVPTSPADPCFHCDGRGRQIVFDVRPRSSGVPEQVRIDGNSVALWYPDGSTGVVRNWMCAPCEGSGLAPSSSLGDMRAVEEWMRLTGVVLAEPSRSEVRGLVLRRCGRRETNQAAGELSMFSDTSRPRKAITGAARC
jgi:hypothetical protein